VGSRRSARIIALQALYQLDITGKTLDDLLKFDWLDRSHDPDVIEYAKALVAGYANNRDFIDEVIRGHLEHWDLKRVSYVDRSILRFSTFSLYFQEDVPSTVVINEAIDLAKIFGTDDSYRFVNGVLDGIRKHRERKT
jgi:transcription antitermination protein NusB